MQVIPEPVYQRFHLITREVIEAEFFREIDTEEGQLISLCGCGYVEGLSNFQES